MALFRSARFREARFVGVEVGIIVYPAAELAERGFKLVFYNPAGVKIGELGSDTPAAKVNAATFEIGEFGCGAFAFTVDDIPSFTPVDRTRVNIHPYFDIEPWFTGFVQKVPDPGAARPLEYSGFGFFAQLNWVTVTQSYGPQDIALIVADIVENIVAVNTQVRYNSAKIETTGYVTSGTIDFDHVFAQSAIQSLAEIAQDFEYGVDDQREFYFRARSSGVMNWFWKGKHFQDLAITADPMGIRNKLYVKGGTVTGGSNYLPPVSDAASIAEHGLREDIITAPELLDTADATRWAEYVLSQNINPITQGQILGFFLDQRRAKIEARGQLRVTTEDGTAYTLPIKRVSYKIDSTGILADIDLGTVYVPFEKHVLKILRRIEEEGRLADKRTEQLA